MKPEPVRIGFVGLGFGAFIAETVISGPARNLFTVAAVCDADPAKAAEFSSRHGVKTYGDLNALLADDSIAAIALITAPAGRAELLSRIIRAGKDVITTKPFERDPVAARTVLEEALSLGRIIHLNSPPPERPPYISQILRWQQEFSLGQPVSCRAEMLASYREKADHRWLDDPELCPAAPIFRLGIYCISDLISLFGRVREVQVMTSRMFTGRPTPDNAQLSLLFENMALGSVHASFCVDNGQHYANSLVLNYERGTIHRNVFPAPYGEAEGSSRLTLAAVPDGYKEVIVNEWRSADISGSYQWALFHEAIVGVKPATVPIDEIVHGVEIIAAMARAEKSGKMEVLGAC